MHMGDQRKACPCLPTDVHMNPDLPFPLSPKNTGVREGSIVRGTLPPSFFWFANFLVLTFTPFVLAIKVCPGITVTDSIPPGTFFKGLFSYSLTLGVFTIFTRSFCKFPLELSTLIHREAAGLPFQAPLPASLSCRERWAIYRHLWVWHLTLENSSVRAKPKFTKMVLKCCCYGFTN